MTTLHLNKEKAPDLWHVLTKICDSGAECELKPINSSGESEIDSETSIGMIPWFSLRPNGFIEGFCTLWKRGFRHFLVVSPAVGRKPWAQPEIELPHNLQAVFEKAVGFWDKPTLEGLKAAVTCVKEAPAWAQSRLKKYAEARILYDDFLYRFSHNSQTDLSNQFLAPARLFALGGVNAETGVLHVWKNIWEAGGSPFVNGEIHKLKKAGGDTGQELADPASRITEALDRSALPALADLENVMIQITQIRENAGLRTRVRRASPSGTASPVLPVGPADEKDGYRILVVDDHAAAWRPVFDHLQRRLANRPELEPVVRFEFSLDGETVYQLDDRPTAIVYCGLYDLIILDVFLGGCKGTDILRRIRRDLSQLPILLWTTSRDEQIAAEATLANGIILKKTTTWAQLADAISTWAPLGKSMRTASLPNPFFNHTIRKPEYRNLAVSFHEWCLKQLDSFHALDKKYFRYFTDHGGRHIVKLWELTEHALRPFLQDDNETVLLKDPKQRELEILGLYLAVICHELGMFPMRIGGKVEDFSRRGKRYLDAVRSLHAVRGMVLLHDGNPSPDPKHIGQYWNDARGRELGAMLRANGFEGLADRLAVLVGYHARVFKGLERDDFLNWEKSKAPLDAKLKARASARPPSSPSDYAFESAYRALAGAFQDPPTRDRLRRQCALFRFIDALDITFSRNPAEFLVGAGTLPAKQYGENLKRELCRTAKIENGDVRVEMAVQAPRFQMVKAIIHYVQEKQLLERDDREKAENAWSFIRSKNAARLSVEAPWNLPDANAWKVSSLNENSVMCLQKPLDCWLKEVWQALIDQKGKPDLIGHLQKLKILDAKAQEPRLLFEGANAIASVTALSVAGELLDEYQAVVEAELSDQIRLPKEFGWGHPWIKPTLPDGLSTLEKVLTPP